MTDHRALSGLSRNGSGPMPRRPNTLFTKPSDVGEYSSRQIPPTTAVAVTTGRKTADRRNHMMPVFLVNAANTFL
jgi:hypothetical protein